MKLLLLSHCLAGMVALVGCTPSSSSETDESGQTGGIGAVECISDADCEEPLLELKARFETGGRYHHEFDSSECELLEVVGEESVAGSACLCRNSDSEGSVTVGPEGLPCFAWGNLGECIFPGSEFNGCEVGADPLCEQYCQELENVLEGEANKSYDVEIRMFECRENNKCISIVRFDDQCIVNQDVLQKSERDCSLSDEELIFAYESAAPSESSEADANGGAPGVE